MAGTARPPAPTSGHQQARSSGLGRDVTLVREGSYLSVRGGLMPGIEAERHFTAHARERDVFSASAVGRGFDGVDMRLDRARATHVVAGRAVIAWGQPVAFRVSTAMIGPPVSRRWLYRFEMIFDAGRYRAYADTVTELCEQLIDGYGELDDDVSQAAARIGHAVRAQVQLQASIVAEADLSRCSPEEKELLLGSRHVPPVLEVWEAEVALVLVDTYYEPLGHLPRPQGRPRGGGPEGSNLVWRPADEAELLGSLADAGVVIVSELD